MVLKHTKSHRNLLTGIGVDLVKIERFRALNLDDPFYRRVFTDAEIEYCQSYSDPFPHFAAIFAGKEAVTKALRDSSSIPFHRIEILHDPDGAPVVRLDTQDTSSNRRIYLSLSHTEKYAAAVAISFLKNKELPVEDIQLLLAEAVRQVLPSGVSSRD